MCYNKQRSFVLFKQPFACLDLHRPYTDHTLTYKRHELRGGRHGLRDEQHEDGEGQQDGDAQGDLLAGVRRQPEAEEAEDGEPEAGEDDVEEVVQRLAADNDSEANVWVGLFATRVVHLYPSGREEQELVFGWLLNV